MRIPALELRGVSYRYPRSDRWALNNVNLTVMENSFLVLAGPTGSGKSTLAKIIRGLHKEYGGEFLGDITVFGQSTHELQTPELGSKVAIVFQNPAYQLHQPRVIDEVMSAPMYQHLPWQECLERAQRSASLVLENGFLDRDPTDLSTGSRKSPWQLHWQ
jgi:energy-coupling factor transporter ATP-binding protein EcfA2